MAPGARSSRQASDPRSPASTNGSGPASSRPSPRRSTRCAARAPRRHGRDHPRCARLRRLAVRKRRAPGRSSARTGPPPLLRVGVVGPLDVSVPRVAVTRGTLASVQRYPLVLVAAGQRRRRARSRLLPLPTPTAISRSSAPRFRASSSRISPASSFGRRRRRSSAEFSPATPLPPRGSLQPPVAWVGPAGPDLVRSFTHGVHQVAGGVTVLVDRTPATPAACKESALSAFLRRAVVVMARQGICAAAVAAAAADQNRVAASVPDFELPDAVVECGRSLGRRRLVLRR